MADDDTSLWTAQELVTTQGHQIGTRSDSLSHCRLLRETEITQPIDQSRAEIVDHWDTERRRKLDQLLEPYLRRDRKSTRLNSSHVAISYAVFCLKKKTK